MIFLSPSKPALYYVETKPNYKVIMKLSALLGLAVAISGPVVSAAGVYKCETGTNHNLHGDCHGSIGDYACSPEGNVVSSFTEEGYAL